MKLKTLFDPKIIMSSVVASVCTGLLFYYGAKSVPLLRQAQRGADGATA